MDFGFSLGLSNIDLWNTDLLDTHSDLLDTDIPSKHLVCLHNVFKTSSRHLHDMSWRRLQDMSSRRLEDVFSVTIFLLPRNLEDVLKASSRRFARCLQEVFKTSLQDVFKTSWKTRNCCAEHVLKTSSRHVLKTSSRPTGLLSVINAKNLICKACKTFSIISIKLPMPYSIDVTWILEEFIIELNLYLMIKNKKYFISKVPVKKLFKLIISKVVEQVPF